VPSRVLCHPEHRTGECRSALKFAPAILGDKSLPEVRRARTVGRVAPNLHAMATLHPTASLFMGVSAVFSGGKGGLSGGKIMRRVADGRFPKYHIRARWKSNPIVFSLEGGRIHDGSSRGGALSNRL
jgi:hypothetical protein